jgi:hypothetical protein
MTTKKTRPHIGAVVVASLAAVLGTAGCADAEAVNLFIKNGDTQPVTVTLRADNNNCYESDQTALGQIWNIPPAGQVKMFFWRVGGHGCNGRQGEFELEFDPAVGASKVTHFDYDSHGGLEVSSGRANVYPGALKEIKGEGNGDTTYTYVTFRLHEPVVAGKSVGHWDKICDNICNYQHMHTVTTTSTTTKNYTESETRSISSSLESKMEFEGIGSLTGTISTETAKTIGKEMSDSFQRGETYSDVDNYVFTPEQMRDLKVYAIWQWVADTYLSNGQIATVRSRSFTCTPDANPPRYLPGAAEAVKACRGG